MLKTLRWLNVQQLYDFNTASMVHKAINNVARFYLSELFYKTKTVHNHHTRGSTHGFFPKHSNLNLARGALSAMVVRYGKDRDVQATEEPKPFKKALREKLLNKTKK